MAVNEERLTLATSKHLITMYKPWKPKGYVQFEIIINVLLSSLRLIWIPMLWVYGHYIYLILAARGQTSDVRIWRLLDVRFWRQKSVSALKGLNVNLLAKTSLSDIENIVWFDTACGIYDVGEKSITIRTVSNCHRASSWFVTLQNVTSTWTILTSSV